jgi:hypothetical protein
LHKELAHINFEPNLKNGKFGVNRLMIGEIITAQKNGETTFKAQLHVK